MGSSRFSLAEAGRLCLCLEPPGPAGKGAADEKKRTAPESGSFHGVDNGTRTHDLQSHNLTP